MRKTHSAKTSGINSRAAVIRRHDLRKIPIPMEKPTKPFRYSFLTGLKNVLKSRLAEKN